MNDRDLRAEVEDRLVDVLDGTADDALLDAIAESDELRDLRHDAERVVAVARDAALDYTVPGELTERLLAALDARASDAPSAANVESAETADVASGTSTQPMAAAPAVASAAGSPGSPALADGDAESPAPEPLLDGDGAPPDVVRLRPRATARTANTPGPRGWLVGTLALAVAAGAAVVLWPRGQTELPPTADLPKPAAGWAGVAAVVSRAAADGPGLERCASDGASCTPLRSGDAFPSGAVLRTDATTAARLELGDGTVVVLDRDTELALDGSAPRAAALRRGSLVADVTHDPTQKARLALPSGALSVLGTKFAVQVGNSGSSVTVSRGAVAMADEGGREVVVRAGERGLLAGDREPSVRPSANLAEALAWSDRAIASDGPEREARGVGELLAKKPGEETERTGAVSLAKHQVSVRISGAMARTEVEEVFANSTGEVLEGIYRFPVPPDAKIERLALEVDGQLLDGAFVDRERAASIWRGAITSAAPEMKAQMREEIIWVPGPWRDPALLEWQRGGRFELRIFPIPANGSRRIVLAYTQVLAPSGRGRSYVYPLAHDPSGTTRIGDFGVDVEVRGHDAKGGVAVRGYGLDRAASDDAVERLAMRRTDFHPAGDLVVEFGTPDATSEWSTWAYRVEAPSTATPTAAVPSGGAAPAGAETGLAPIAAVTAGESYAAIALRPALPRADRAVERDVVIAVDSSRSMYGESYERARVLVRRLVAEMDSRDRVTVLACDSTCRRSPGGLASGGADAAARADEFLATLTPDGASDVVAAVEAAADLATPGRALRVLYVGDGNPTVGPIHPGTIARAVERELPGAVGTVTAVGVGSESDTTTLQALARGGGGVALPYAPGRTSAEMAYTVLQALYGTGLRDVAVELPPGLEAAVPARLDGIPAGGEGLVVARMTRPAVEGDVVLRGRLGEVPFERRYPVRIEATNAPGNAFVPRLYAAGRISDLEADGSATARGEAIALSVRHHVASRYTSLLVLESEAMFQAFGLERSQATSRWTGEELAFGSVGRLAGSHGDDLGLSGIGEGGGGRGESAGARGAIGAPKKAKSPSFDMPFDLGYGGALDDFSGASPEPESAERRVGSPFRDDGGTASRGSGSADWDDPADPWGPPPSTAEPARPAPRATATSPWPGATAPGGEKNGAPLTPPPPPPPIVDDWEPPPPRMIPMVRRWERKGVLFPTRTVPSDASDDALGKALTEFRADERRRSALQRLFLVEWRSGDLSTSSELADRWVAKAPLDPAAMTARADLFARRAQRDQAIRVLGSVVDLRPRDVAAQKRLSRLHRWAGRPELGCRHSVAIAQLRPDEAELLVEAVRCTRALQQDWLADAVLAAATDDVRRRTETLLQAPAPDEDAVRGELQVDARWTSDADLDIALVHPTGHYVTWLGAPTRERITASDVTSLRHEAIGLGSATRGEYVVEILRASGAGPVRGTLTIKVGEETLAPVEFELVDTRKTLAVVEVQMVSRLVPY